jgi:hypothetical protein
VNRYTVIGFYEETGQTFADFQSADDPYSAMRFVARQRGASANIAILGAVRSEVKFTPACEESENLAYACDLANI